MPVKCVADLTEHNLPTWVLKDINQRITDWLSGGGTMEDGYINQQYRFANNIIKSRNKVGGIK